MRDKERGKRVPECCQNQGRCRALRQRWCTVGRIHRYRSCALCVRALTPPPTVGLSAFYRGMEDISCLHSTINASIIISTVCSTDQMTKKVFRPAGLDEILSTRRANCTISSVFCCPFFFWTAWFTSLWWNAACDKIWSSTLRQDCHSFLSDPVRFKWGIYVLLWIYFYVFDNKYLI